MTRGRRCCAARDGGLRACRAGLLCCPYRFEKSQIVAECVVEGDVLHPLLLGVGGIKWNRNDANWQAGAVLRVGYAGQSLSNISAVNHEKPQIIVAEGGFSIGFRIRRFKSAQEREISRRHLRAAIST